MEHDPSLFESAWLKWAWAKAHAETLKAYVWEWGKNPNRDSRIGLLPDYDAKHHRFNVYVATLPALPIEWSVVIGDIAHNYRGALEHVAWALATRGNTPPSTLSERAQNQIGFPIYECRTTFNSAIRNVLPGVRRADIAVVRRYQPYHGGKRRSRRHAFWVLRLVSNDDKHRTIQPTFMSPQAASYELTGAPIDCAITRIPTSFVLRQPLQIGAQLAPIYVRKTGPNPYLPMRGQLAVQPAIQGVLLGQWLDGMELLVSELLKSLSDPPTELLAKLGG